MKKWPEPKLCVNCKWSKPKKESEWNNVCWHPLVVMSDAWALSNNIEGKPIGSSCQSERDKRYFAKCGTKGKLYEPKIEEKCMDCTKEMGECGAKAVNMTFGYAIEALKRGTKMCRAGWNGKGMYLYKVSVTLPFPPLNDNSKWSIDSFPESEFIIMKTADNKLIPWLASQSDILSSDWEVFEIK